LTTELCSGRIYAGFPENWSALPVKERERWRDKFGYRRAKAKGLCPRCQKNKPPEGYVTCQDCRDYVIARNRE
jgi:hypothetical protein